MTDAIDNPLLTQRKFRAREALGSILAGGSAGISVDAALFPLDSIKTRLQASTKKVDYSTKAASISKFRGLTSAMLASFPCAATFWVSYEFSKYMLHPHLGFSLSNMVAASIGECTQALIRTPSEVVK